MSNLNKLDLRWVQDVKLHLTAKGIKATIKTPIANKPIDKSQKAIAIIFIRRHIYDALQTEYLAEDDPRTLWLTLVNYFDHQKDIYLPEARHDWQHLHFQDFKQQYRAQKFTKFSNLISVLLLAEKHHQLLMKNHQARPAGSNAVPESHAINSSYHKRRKHCHSHGNRQQAPP
ncbi:uncharacterized protein [Pyrus communis]|uniref:uncharacterized protein n=1 Tax=Pyrus communis TaxID=23211 RepID=UPI0035BFE2F0